jgi:hypothetical protein
MKMRTLTLCALVTLLAVTSCKKEKDSNNPPTPPANTDPELLGPETSKVFHYSFNGNLNDGSGNNMDAADSNNITYTADRLGRANQAAVFGGSGNSSNILTPSLNSKNISFPFSVSFWFKAGNVSSSQTLIKSDGFERTNYTGFWIQLGITGAGSMAFNFGNNTGASGASRNSLITPSIFAANTWYHIVVNVRGAGDMDFYVNGVENNTCYYDGNATSIVFAQPEARGILGTYDGSQSEFGGALDDYRIYKKILSQTEVSALYNFQP